MVGNQAKILVIAGDLLSSCQCKPDRDLSNHSGEIGNRLQPILCQQLFTRPCTKFVLTEGRRMIFVAFFEASVVAECLVESVSQAAA